MTSIFKIGVLSFTLLLLVFSVGFAAMDEGEENGKEVTITGVVSENFQIITEKEEVIEIGDTDAGDEVSKLVGEKVKAKGLLSIHDETKFLNVESFEVVK